MSALAETIDAQGSILRRVLDIDLEPALARLDGARRVWLVGTGTSEHAAHLGASMLASAGVEALGASSASFCSSPPKLNAEDAVIVISHTTQTAFARAARRRADAEARLVSITGEGKQWPEALQVAPPERSETYTASYLATLLALARLAVALGSAELDGDDVAEVPDLVDAAIAADVPPLDPPKRLTVLFGAGAAAISAREGALKLREAARVAAEGFESENLLHGSAALLGPRDLLLGVDPAGDGSTLGTGLMRAGAAAGCAVGELEAPPGVHPLLAQLPMTVRLQALASHWSKLLDTDPDRVIVPPWDSDDLWEAGAP